MTLIQQFLDELEREAPRTRAVLAGVPNGKDDWRPHPKSMALGRLAGLVATMPSWMSLVIEQDELNLTPPDGQGQLASTPVSELIATHDKFVEQARESLTKTTDQILLTTNWRLIAGGHVVMTETRRVVLCDTMNHLAHHRGQLTVYLRLLDQKVPSVYGPTADDQTFR